MISATRRWLRRNRNGIAIGAGVVGVTYLAGQYVLGKINEARERMQMDRIAKEKYVTIHLLPRSMILTMSIFAASGDALSRTKPTVQLPSSHYCPP
jgi:hypothetical protein